MLNRFHLIPERNGRKDGQTERQTDRRTDLLYQYLLVCDRKSFDFTITRSFMKLFRTGSATVVTDCQKFSYFFTSHLPNRHTYSQIPSEIPVQ